MYKFTFFQNHNRYGFETYITYSASLLLQQTRVHNSVKICVRIMALFRLRILVKFFCTNILIFKTTTDIALKHTTHFHYHYFQQQTRVHNSVKVFVWIIALFRLRILVKFFVPIYFFKKTLQILLWNLQHLFTIITSINRQENITLSMFLYELLPFFT